MDRLDAMSVLLAVVDAGSLSAASRKLGTPLATVSRKLADLEEHLGTRLLNRSSRGMVLTESGRAFVASCRRILEQVDEAERAASGEYRAPKGHLTVTAPVVFGRRHLLPIALGFLAANPDIDLRLVLNDHVLNLLEDNLDVALRIGVLPDSRLVATRIGATRHVLCASPTYLAAHGRPQRPDDLAAHDCIAVEGLAPSRAWRFGGRQRSGAVEIEPRLSVTTAEAAIDAAVAGGGIARVLSYMVEDEIRSGTLEGVLQPYEPAPWPIHLVHAGQTPLPLKLRAFLDWAAPRLRARLA